MSCFNYRSHSMSTMICDNIFNDVWKEASHIYQLIHKNDQFSNYLHHYYLQTLHEFKQWLNMQVSLNKKVLVNQKWSYTYPSVGIRCFIQNEKQYYCYDEVLQAIKRSNGVIRLIEINFAAKKNVN